jgi:hypothetical protein
MGHRFAAPSPTWEGPARDRCHQVVHGRHLEALVFFIAFHQTHSSSRPIAIFMDIFPAYSSEYSKNRLRLKDKLFGFFLAFLLEPPMENSGGHWLFNLLLVGGCRQC